jgi:hypothetical protein
MTTFDVYLRDENIPEFTKPRKIGALDNNAVAYLGYNKCMVNVEPACETADLLSVGVNNIDIIYRRLAYNVNKKLINVNDFKSSLDSLMLASNIPFYADVKETRDRLYFTWNILEITSFEDFEIVFELPSFTFSYKL